MDPIMRSVHLNKRTFFKTSNQRKEWFSLRPSGFRRPCNDEGGIGIGKAQC